MSVPAQAVPVDEDVDLAAADVDTAIIADPIKPAPSNPTLEVVAPSDLNGGYEFFVDAGNNTSYKVRVPEGGVRSGQRFQASIVSDAVNRGPHNIPFGRWRDGLCDCCAFGCCHPVCCLTFWCQPCSLGQVLTRMNMFWSGGESRNGETPRPSACKILFVLGILQIVLSTILGSIFQAGINTAEDANGDINWSSSNAWAGNLRWVLNTCMYLFVVIVTFRLRNSLRKKYDIPEKTCNGCEDCCCAFWCMGCTLCQTHRHTADFHAYPAACCQCCTEMGLPPGAPDVV